MIHSNQVRLYSHPLTKEIMRLLKWKKLNWLDCTQWNQNPEATHSGVTAGSGQVLPASCHRGHGPAEYWQPEPVEPANSQIRNGTAIITNVWALGETKCHSSLSNEKSICLEEGEKVKADISANLFWLRKQGGSAASRVRSEALSHVAERFSWHSWTQIERGRKETVRAEISLVFHSKGTFWKETNLE